MNEKHPTPGSFGVEARSPQTNEESALQDALALITFIIQDEHWPAFWAWCQEIELFVKGELEEGEEDFDLEEGLQENMHIDGHVIADMITKIRAAYSASRNQLN